MVGSTSSSSRTEDDEKGHTYKMNFILVQIVGGFDCSIVGQLNGG